MFRIDDATAATALPAPEAAGTEGYFTEGNPTAGTPATNVRGSWLNMIQEELRAIVVAGGLTPSKTTYNQVLSAIKRIGQNTIVLVDTGAANAYMAVNATPLVVGTWVDGVVQAVKIAHTNTGASTYAPDGLAAIPIYGLGLQPLQGGELFAGGVAALMKQTIPGVNSGNPICVLMECAGGAQQIAPATQSQHAAQYGQVLPRTGGTLTGSLNFNGANGSQNLLQWEIGGAPRWALTTDASGETGSNAGTNLLLAVYNDGGAYLGSAWTINRASQVVNFTQTPTSVTAAQFDNGANVATTAFAKSAGFRHAASVQLSASTTLSVAHAGKVVVLSGTGGYTITLPNRANYPDGESITLVSTASSPVTVQRQGTDSIYPNNAPITSFTMANGDTAVIESSAAVTGWNVLSGSVQLGYAGAFGSSIAGSGYQKLPSGLILQWGTGTGGTALSFPLAFPNSLYGITVQIADANVSETGYALSGVSGFTPKTYNTSGSAITAAVFWMAIGK